MPGRASVRQTCSGTPSFRKRKQVRATTLCDSAGTLHPLQNRYATRSSPPNELRAPNHAPSASTATAQPVPRSAPTRPSGPDPEGASTPELTPASHDSRGADAHENARHPISAGWEGLEIPFRPSGLARREVMARGRDVMRGEARGNPWRKRDGVTSVTKTLRSSRSWAANSDPISKLENDFES